MHLDTEEIQEALIHQLGVVLKPRLIVQCYLGGTLVALETCRLLTFLTAFHVIHIYQRGSKRGNVLYYAVSKRMICVRLHMEDGVVFWLAAPESRERGLVIPQSLVSPRQNDHGVGSHESQLHHAQQARV